MRISSRGERPQTEIDFWAAAPFGELTPSRLNNQLECRQYHGLFLAEDLDQKGLRVQRADTLRRQVLWPELAKVEG